MFVKLKSLFIGKKKLTIYFQMDKTFDKTNIELKTQQ